MLGLLVLLLLAFPIAAIVGVVLAISTRDRLRGLERRLAMIERRLEGLGPTPAPRSSVEPSTPPAPQPTIAPAPPPRGPPPPLRFRRRHRRSRRGGQRPR